MRHLKKGRKLGRISKQRRALLKTMLGSLIMKEKICTTEAKAKEIKTKIDPIINRAKKVSEGKSKVSIIRELGRYLPQMAIVKLNGDFLKRFEKRIGGYVRIIKIERRKGDGSKMAVVEFV